MEIGICGSIERAYYYYPIINSPSPRGVCCPVDRMSQLDTPLYQPSSPENTPTFRFLDFVNQSYSANLRDYHDLYTWSITNIDKFWSLVWDYTNVIGYKGNHIVDSSALPPSNPPWSA